MLHLAVVEMLRAATPAFPVLEVASAKPNERETFLLGDPSPVLVSRFSNIDRQLIAYDCPSLLWNRISQKTPEFDRPAAVEHLVRIACFNFTSRNRCEIEQSAELDGAGDRRSSRLSGEPRQMMLRRVPTWPSRR
jgi:hypothetical protein